MKRIIAIGDGMADNPVEELSGKTPLETALTPVMDRLAQNGQLGLVRTIPAGIAPGSDTAFLSILGYDPRRFFSGRAPLEAAGSGITLQEGDIAYRCNMVAYADGPEPFEEKKILSHSGGSIEGEEALGLMDTLLSDADFARLAAQNQMVFHKSPSFRHIAVQRGTDIQNLLTIPPHDHLGETIGGLMPSGCPAADGLFQMMRRAHDVLDKHPINEARRARGQLPANGIWFWAEGVTLTLDDFQKKHNTRGFVVSAVPLVHGIGALCGLSSREVPGATGELDTNFEGKADAVLAGLSEGFDFALMHLEAPDECTHNGDLPGKVKAIEYFDGRSLGRLVESLEKQGEPFRILVMSDHKTLTKTRGHDADPVPYILYDSQKQLTPGGPGYTEANGAKGPFIEEGHTLIARLFEEPLSQ